MNKWLLVLSLVGLGCGSHQDGSGKSNPDASSAHDGGKAGAGGSSGGGAPTAGKGDIITGMSDAGGSSGGGVPMAGSGDIITGTPDAAAPGACVDLANACDEERVSCSGDTLITCAKNEAGCLVTTRTNCTRGGTNFCDSSLSPPACAVDKCASLANRCTSAGISCDGATLVTCANDDDGCLVATRTDCTTLNGKNTCGGSPAECSFDPCRDAQGKPKPNVCATPEDSCAADYWVHCVPDSDGCNIATRTDCTKEPGKNKCDAAANPAACSFDPCRGVTDCLASGKTCDGVKLIDCAPNSDGCLVKTTTDCTQNHTLAQTCEDQAGTAACSTCTDAPACSGKAEGDASCDGNVFQTCSDTDGDTCLNAVREDCGASFSCDADATKRCVYTGSEACSSAVTSVLREPMSYGPFDTANAGNDYSAYTCPGLLFGLQGTSPELLFAVDVAPKSVVSVALTSTDGFTGNAAMLVLLKRCGDDANDMALTAESSCQTVSSASVSYANETATDTRIYVVVDADRANNADNVGTFGLTLDTRPFACGDGRRDGAEQCDDGNIASGDGCTPNCTRETGFSCTSSNPSICTRRPTDGICANVVCPALPSDAPTNTQTCCTSDQHCGVAYALIYGAGCIERDQPGQADTDCPAVPSVFSPLVPALEGCCRPDNKCGLLAATGGGCIERSVVWTNMVDGFGDFLFTGPFASMACTYSP